MSHDINLNLTNSLDILFELIFGKIIIKYMPSSTEKNTPQNSAEVKLKWSNQAGFNLTEFIVALIIVSSGLFVFAQWQLSILKSNQSAFLQSIALLQANSLAEALYSCRNVDANAVKICQTNFSNRWAKQLASELPQAKMAFVAVGQYSTIKISWPSLIATVADKISQINLFLFL